MIPNLIRNKFSLPSGIKWTWALVNFVPERISYSKQLLTCIRPWNQALWASSSRGDVRKHGMREADKNKSSNKIFAKSSYLFQNAERFTYNFANRDAFLYSWQNSINELWIFKKKCHRLLWLSSAVTNGSRNHLSTLFLLDSQILQSLV